MKIGMQEITVEGIGTRVSVSLRGPTAVVRLFNPPHGCMDEPMEAELTLALAYMEQCTLIRVVILAGRDPGMFVRHYDVAVLYQPAQQMRSRGKMFSLERPVPPGGIHRCLDDVLARALALPAALDAVPVRACANIKYLVRSAGRWTTSEGMDAERTLLCDCMVDPADVPLSACPRPGVHQ